MATGDTWQQGDAVEWVDSNVDPEARRVGAVTAVLSVQLLVICTDGTERFVMKNDRTLKRYKSE